MHGQKRNMVLIASNVYSKCIPVLLRSCQVNVSRVKKDTVAEKITTTYTGKPKTLQSMGTIKSKLSNTHTCTHTCTSTHAYTPTHTHMHMHAHAPLTALSWLKCSWKTTDSMRSMSLDPSRLRQRVGMLL